MNLNDGVIFVGSNRVDLLGCFSAQKRDQAGGLLGIIDFSAVMSDIAGGLHLYHLTRLREFGAFFILGGERIGLIAGKKTHLDRFAAAK